VYSIYTLWKSYLKSKADFAILQLKVQLGLGLGLKSLKAVPIKRKMEKGDTKVEKARNVREEVNLLMLF
jgi:hypothetical protein